MKIKFAYSGITASCKKITNILSNTGYLNN